MTPLRVTLVLPAFNEAARLGGALDELFGYLDGNPVRDTQCGFKGFRREAARDLFGRQRITSIVFDVELIHLAQRRNYRLEVVPVRWSDRRGSRMRARPGLALQVAWDLFRIPLIHRAPGRVAAPAGSVQHEPEPRTLE